MAVPCVDGAGVTWGLREGGKTTQGVGVFPPRAKCCGASGLRLGVSTMRASNWLDTFNMVQAQSIRSLGLALVISGRWSMTCRHHRHQWRRVAEEVTEPALAKMTRNDGLGIVGVKYRRFDGHRDRGSSVSECNLQSPLSTSRWTPPSMGLYGLYGLWKVRYAFDCMLKHNGTAGITAGHVTCQT